MRYSAVAVAGVCAGAIFFSTSELQPYWSPPRPELRVAPLQAQPDPRIQRCHQPADAVVD